MTNPMKPSTQQRVGKCTCGHTLKQHSETVNWCCEIFDCPCKKYSTQSPPPNREKRISTEDLLFIVATRVVKALTGSTVNQATYRGHFEHKKTGKKYTYTFKMKI